MVASLSLRSGGLTLQTLPLAFAMLCWAALPPLPLLCPDFAPGGEHATISNRLTTAAANRLTVLVDLKGSPFFVPWLLVRCCLTAYAMANLRAASVRLLS